MSLISHKSCVAIFHKKKDVGKTGCLFFASSAPELALSLSNGRFNIFAVLRGLCG